MTSPFPIHFSYVRDTDLADVIGKSHVLKAIGYSTAQNHRLSEQHIQVELKQLNEPNYTEVWLSLEPVEYSTHDGIIFSANRQVLCGHLQIDESDPARLEKATYAAYQNIYSSLEAMGYPHLIRTWNYLPDINQHISAMERYQSFCVGRADATATAKQANTQLPAASAIGSHQGAFVIYFIAAKEPGLQLENPLQTSAFEYPEIYSPRSPSFSRAMIKSWQDSVQLFISGTASVVGHQTMHIGDVKKQFEQTLNNLQTLADKAVTKSPSLATVDLSDVLWKIYLRDSAYLSLLQDLISTSIQPKQPVLYLQGDICRADLLLEIEGIYSQA